MLVNGKEVFDLYDYDMTPVQAYNVQHKINAEENIQDDAKSDAVITSGAIESSESRNGAPSFQIGMFETIGSTTAKRGLRTREQLYETYIKMSSLGIVKRALEIIADEASQKNDDNEVIVINSNNEKIYDILRELFFDKLSINTELWSIIIEMLKMGDCFYEIALSVKDGQATGIRRIKYIDPSKIEAHEKDGRIDYYLYKSRANKNNEQIEQRLFPWQIVDFKIEDKETKPYGKSLLQAGVRSYERLIATEDIFLTYTISRTPMRRVFKIDVGGLSPLEAQRAMREIRDGYRSQQVIDANGNMNQISSILSITSDIFIPVREGQAATTIENLEGGAMNMNQNMTFLENFKKDLIASFNVPAEYLGTEQGVGAEKSTTLSQKDIKFARFVERIQQQVVKALYKIATLELFLHGFSKDDLKDFTIELVSPSTTKEISEASLLDTKVQLFQSMQGLDVFPTNWLLKKVLRLSDKEISEIEFMKAIEEKKQQGQVQGMPGAPMGGISQLPSEPGSELPPEGEGEMPQAPERENPEEVPQELPAEEPESEPEVQLQSVSFLNIEGQKFLIEDEKSFVKLIKYIDEQKKYKNDEPSDFMKEINGENKPRHISNSKNPYYFLSENNEFGGLSGFNGKRRSCMRYDSNGNPKSILI